MASTGPEFVKWREEFVSQEKGSRLVHYYLEDATGASHLAVVGTERSLRHMLYVVSDDFRRAQGCDDSSGFFSRKWRSRREVVDWLVSFLPAKAFVPKFLTHGMGDDIRINGFSDAGGYLCHNLGKACNSDIMWSGSFWTCGKQLRHYQAFCRNGTTISIHSFVLVMSEEENRYLAYLEDMYEDKKGQKKVKVRWFHQNQEFACTIPPPAPHPSEVFITPYSQVISVECVDDIATVLTPEHYEKCMVALPQPLAGMRLCFRQYSKNKFKHFDLSTLRGYFSQAALLSLKTLSENEKDGSDILKNVNHCIPKKIKFSKQHERLYSKCLGTKICRGPLTNFIPSYQKLSSKQPPKKPLSVKFVGPRNQLTQPYNVGDKIELLCQDSGIRGCWFKCMVIKLSHNRLKVQYDDLQDVDNCGSLEEWLPAFRLAAPDKLGLRCPGRPTIRPFPTHSNLLDGAALLPGTAVDVWWNDGWWEGVLVSVDSCEADNLQVYFPGEDVFLVCQLKNVRISKDWVNNQWVDIETKPDVLSRISSFGDRTRLPVCLINTRGAESGSSAMSNQEVAATQANSNEEEKQTEASLSGRTSNFAEDEKQTILGKRLRDDDAEEDCNGEVGVDAGES